MIPIAAALSKVRPYVQRAAALLAELGRERRARELAEARRLARGAAPPADGRRRGEGRRRVQPVAHDEQVAVGEAERRLVEACAAQQLLVVPREAAQLLRRERHLVPREVLS